MKLIGEKIFARNADGRLASRIGTLFLRTPGLVTTNGIHAMQRVLWLEELSKERPLTPSEEEAEIAESVDLIFTEDLALIRPNPDRMDLALKADEILQTMVPKLQVRFLNTSSAKVRDALRGRGENWRMARQPISQDDMEAMIENAKVAIGESPLYRYNPTTGTRYLTAGAFAEAVSLDEDGFRRQVAEIVAGMGRRNRSGHPEVDLFPTTTPIEIRRALRELKPDALDDAALREACAKILLDWRMSLPAELRDESAANFDWRNAMCRALTAGPNETSAEESELISGISPEFYRQIEWLPGARIDDGEVVFDPVYEEAARTQDPKLLALCDNRVKSFLFNTTRLFGRLRFVNIGRIAASLSRHPVAGDRRGHLYIMQYQDELSDEPRVMMIRLQKWGVAEHLDEGKSLLQSILEADEYSDYILDRRLMCSQFGMNLPRRIGYGHFSEKYRGANQYNGVSLRSAYFIRGYVHGMASDKVPLAKYRNPAWSQKFAFLMGEAAAIDLVVGRRSSSTRELLFDNNYEVVVCGADGMPAEVRVTDHAGSFVDYESPLSGSVADYAAFARRREKMVSEYPQFAAAYVEGFRRKLSATQAAYRARRRAFDNLFSDRPYDTNGSGAYRWACALRRLDDCDPDALAAALSSAIADDRR